MTSVLQQWVMELPLREQGVLVLALRGPDGARKEHGAKNLVRAMRGCTMVTGATGEALIPGQDLPDDSFMQMYRVGHPDDVPWNDALREFFRAWDEFNVHWLLHFMHAAAICGIRHPNQRIRDRWAVLYARSCRKAHLKPETAEEIIDRLKDGHKPDDPE